MKVHVDPIQKYYEFLLLTGSRESPLKFPKNIKVFQRRFSIYLKEKSLACLDQRNESLLYLVNLYYYKSTRKMVEI